MRTIYIVLIVFCNLLLVLARTDCPYCWTHESGSPEGNLPPVYDAIVANATTPGARGDSCQWVDDENGYLYLFGGIYWTLSNQNYLYADMWRYSLANNTWTFIAGSNISNYAGNYGTINVSAPNNVPPARYGCASWFDNSTRRLYLFGGTTASVYFSDLWYFSLDTSQFVWVAGPNTTNDVGTFGQLRQFSPTSNPPARHDASSCIDLTRRRLILFGGGYHPCTGGIRYNDLWLFDLELQQWSWWHGQNKTNQAGIYGAVGVSASENTPGARILASKCFITAMNNNSGIDTVMFIYGGFGDGDGTTSIGVLDDMWSFSFTSSAWTWIGGASTASQTPSYPLTSPGPRAMAGLGWEDPDQNGFFVFGGYVSLFCFMPSPEFQSNVWFYNWHTSTWHFIQGTNASNVLPAVYGTVGVPAVNNTPATRTGLVMWTSPTQRKLYMFGGTEYPLDQRQHYSSMWSLSTAVQVLEPSPPSVVVTNITGIISSNITIPNDVAVQQNETIVIGATVSVTGNATIYGTMVIQPLDGGLLRVYGCITVIGSGELIVNVSSNKQPQQLEQQRITIAEYDSSCPTVNQSVVTISMTPFADTTPADASCFSSARPSSYQVDNSVHGQLLLLFLPAAPSANCNNSPVDQNMDLGLIIGVSVVAVAIVIVTIIIVVFAVHPIRRRVFPFLERTQAAQKPQHIYESPSI